MAPSTSGLGARSAPMASRAMMVGIFACQLQTSIVTKLRFCNDVWICFPDHDAGLAGSLFDLDDLAALVVAAFHAGAMRQFTLVAVGTLGQRLRRQMIVGAALGRARLRMAPFWIRHDNLLTGPPTLATVTLNLALQLLLDLVERIPARIAHMLLTITLLFQVQIASAMRTQPLAIFAAQGSNRSRQQHLLTQGIFQQQALALIIADFGFGFGNRYFIGPPVHAQWAVDQVETLVDIVDHRIQATGTAELQVGLYVSHQADIFNILMVPAMFDDQLCTAFAVQKADLAEIRPKLDCAGLIVFVKLQLMEFQFPNTNQHSSTGLSLERSHRPCPIPECQGLRKQTRRGLRDAVLQANLLTGNTGRYRWAGLF